MKAVKSLQTLLGFSSIVVSMNIQAAESLQTVTVTEHKTATGGAGSYAPTFSANGRYVVFVSHANNLATNDDRSSFLDVFRHDLVTGDTVLVSVSASGAGGGDENSNYPEISADGRYVAFVSAAGNLVNNDTNGQADVFVRDLVTGTTTLGSVNAAGTQSGKFLNNPINVPWNANPRLSANGRKVVFDSLAPDLTANDTNEIRDVFLRDLDSGVTVLISVGTSITNTGLNYSRFGSFAPMMTPDGNRVAFSSTATNDSLGLGNPMGEVCVRDVAAGITWWVSSNAPAYFVPPFNGGSTNPVLSADGHRVVYLITSLGVSSAFLVSHDLESGQEFIITSNALPRSLPSLSADGRYVAYQEALPSGSDIYVWDAQAQSKTLVSVSAGGTVRASYSPVITPDGRFVAFVSSTSGLATNEVTADFQVYVRDLVAGTTRLVSANLEGNGTTDHSYVVPSIKGDGTLVAFDSTASDLVADDLNRASDVFVRDIGGATTALLSRRQAGLPSATGPSFVRLAGLSADGRFLLYGMADGYEMPGDTNRFLDLFVRDRVVGTNISVTLMANGQATTNFTARDGVLSGNGRYVAYASAPGLPPSFGIRLLRRDLQTGLDEVVTNNPGSVYEVASQDIRVPMAMSGDGNQIAFLGAATPAQVYVRDMVAGTNLLASRNRFGTGGCNNACSNPLLSPDGRWCLFISSATDLATNPVTGLNLFARDLVDGTLILLATNFSASSSVIISPVISANSRRVAYVQPGFPIGIVVYDFDTRITKLAHSPGQFFSVRKPALSADGRYVAFEGRLAYSPYGSAGDVYRTDLESGVVTLVSVSKNGPSDRGANRLSYGPSISADGRYVAFYSFASNLEARSTNGLSSVYLRDIWSQRTLLVSQSSDGMRAGSGGSQRPMMSADGRVLAFESFASDLTSDDFNGAGDIFVLNLGGFDSDGDGMDDAWEMAYFNGLSRDGTGDFDQDGATDLQEFRAGTDPTNGGSVFHVLTLSPPAGGGTTALWTAVPGKLYRVQYKTTVTDPVWTDVPGDVTAAGTTASKAISTVPAGQAEFFRVLLLQ